MARHRSAGSGDTRLPLAFGLMLVVVVATRLVVVWLGGSTGWPRLAASVVLVVVLVGIPAAIGLRGLYRGR